MSNYWPSRSVSRWMSYVRTREIRNMVLLSTFTLLLTCFLFWVSLLFDVCMIGKSTVLVICLHKRVKLIVFTVSIKFGDESGLAILNNVNATIWQNDIKKTNQELKSTFLEFKLKLTLCLNTVWNVSTNMSIFIYMLNMVNINIPRKSNWGW